MTGPIRSPLGARAPLAGRRFPFLENIIFVDSVDSTNDLGKSVAEKLLADGTEIGPTALVSRRQRAGRGRRGRRWISPDDTSLAVSLLLPWPAGPERVRVPIRLGVSLARGLSARFRLDVRLKWPNDLLVGRKKLGGILVEARASDEEGYAVAGIGLNVAASRERLDAAGLRDAVSLAVAGVPAGLLEGEAPLIALLESVDQGLTCRDVDLAAAFDAVSAHRKGEALTVSDAGRETTGAYLGVTEDGFLRLGTASGVETLVSGEIGSF
ncbi:MAG: biotin--[acetyl-CoA-carboxylase] ligase [Thermoanaerobaculia bacterium]